MLVDNPIQITLQELRALAAEAKGKVNKLILHWTAGLYRQREEARASSVPF